MTRVTTRVLLGLLLSCGSVGCGGYWPLRWPNQALWTPAPSERNPIPLPLDEAETFSSQVTQEGVTIAADLLDWVRARELFQTDLVRHQIQPLLLVIRNGSDQPYTFRKTSVGVPTIPAEVAARWAIVHPTVQAARTLRWLTFFLPGLIFESVIEPLTTMDFPGIEEAAQRPPRSERHHIIEEFVTREIPDGEIDPGHTLAGALFIRPLPLGSVIPLTLMNTRTQQPLVLHVALPPPIYGASREYPAARDAVWRVALRTSTAMASWRLTSVDATQGVIVARTGVTFLRWTTASQLTVTIQSVAAQRTKVDIRSTLLRADSLHYGEHSRTIDRLFETLDGAFPQTIAPTAAGRPMKDHTLTSGTPPTAAPAATY